MADLPPIVSTAIELLTQLADEFALRPGQPVVFHRHGEHTLLDPAIALDLVAKRLENIANNDPPKVWVISDNTFYSPYERTADEINIIGRIRWFAREI